MTTIKFHQDGHFFKISSENSKEVYEVRANQKTMNWMCTCWYNANRPSETCGYCNHILNLLYKYDYPTYKIEFNRRKDLDKRFIQELKGEKK